MTAADTLHFQRDASSSWNGVSQAVVSVPLGVGKPFHMQGPASEPQVSTWAQPTQLIFLVVGRWEDGLRLGWEKWEKLGFEGEPQNGSMWEASVQSEQYKCEGYTKKEKAESTKTDLFSYLAAGPAALCPWANSEVICLKDTGGQTRPRCPFPVSCASSFSW